MRTLPLAEHPPTVWGIAGLDTAGGAGLSADQRAADALGVHLCPVAAALTAQHSQGVQGVFPVDAATLQAQMQALAQDLPPRAIKTGLLGSVQAIEQVAHWVDHFRARTPDGHCPHRQLALVVDPVLGASSGGAAFSNEAIVQAYRTHLLPRATVLTPNLAEAQRLLGGQPMSVPDMAQALCEAGARSVVITGGDDTGSPHEPASAHSLDWLHTPHAQGWLSAPRVDTVHTHGTGCTFASGVAAAWALGHVEADAIVLAKMLTHHALSQGHAAGQGAGPVKARPGFAAGPQAGGAPLPWLGIGRDLPWRLSLPGHGAAEPCFVPFTPPADGLYGIVATHTQIEAALQAGLRCVQLRHKGSEGLGAHLSRSLQAAARHGALCFVNDHWQAALHAALPTPEAPGFQLGLHLGQEDLLALSDAERATLLAARHRVMLGISSHSLWELARAAGCGASTIACGPVQATTTKDMPWHPQGAHNLRWWVAHSPVPVLAIGGLLTASDLARFAPCQSAALCVVRGLGSDLASMQAALPALRQAARAPGHAPCAPLALPHPVLPHPVH